MDVERIDPEKLKQSPTYKEELDDQTRYGSSQWGGFARRGKWVSLVVEVQNTTEDKPYAGNIRVQLDPSRASGDTGERPYTTRYRQEFELAPKTTQSFYFSVLCPEFDFNSVHIAIEANGRRYDRDVGLYELDSAREDLIVVVSDRAAAFKFLTKRAGDEVDTGRDQGPIGRRVAVVQPADLPNRWYNLTLANLIIIDGPPREGLTDEQIEALRGYCQAGGHVLISSGMDPARLRMAEGHTLSIADLAGVRVRELSRVKQLDLAPGWVLSEKEEGIPVVNVTPVHEGGTVLVFRNRQTQLVERLNRQVGLGGVSFLSFSLGEEKLKTWPERSSIPLTLLERGRQRGLFAYQEKPPSQQQNWMPEEDEAQAPRDAVERLREQLDSSFSKDTPVETPKRGVAASFLLLYLLVAVPLNYFIFGWFRRREIAWAAVPVWALFFSIAAYVVGFQQGRLTVDQLTVVEAGADQGEGMARTFMSVYAPWRGNYRLQFEADTRMAMAPQAGPGHLVSRGFKTRGITSFLPEMDILEEANGDLLIEDLLIYSRSTRRLELQHRASLGKGISISMAPDGKGQTNVQIQNGSPFQLASAVLAYRSADSRWRGVRLGNSALAKNMPAPQQFTVSMGPRDGQEINDVFFARPPIVSSGTGQITVARAQSLGAFVQSRLGRYHETLLLAWVDGGMLPVTIQRGSRVIEDVERGMTLLLIPVGDGAGGGSQNWSARFTTDPGRLDHAEWEPFALKKGMVRIAQLEELKRLVGQTTIDFRTPVGVQNLTERDFALSFKMRYLTQQEYMQRASGRYNYYNNAPALPGMIAGDLKVSIASWKSDLTLSGAWRTIPLTSFRLKPGDRQAFSLRGKLARDELGPEGRIMLRVRLENMSVKGQWSEVDWPMDLLEFQTDVTGPSGAR
jgi:hypothetical protein